MTVRDPSIQTTSRTWLAYIALVALLTALCFSGVADLGLDTHDDDTFRDHERIARDFSFFFSPEKDQPTGRPTIELVKYLAYLAWGNDPAVFHLLVVFFHALASLLLARTAHHLGASLGLSMVGGLLFLVNVAHFQAVYWISALDYPVALICTLGAVTCYVDYDRGAAPARLRLYAFHAILVLGVLAHPSVVAAWLFCLYWAWRQSTPFKEIARRLLPFAALLLPTALLALHLSPRSASTWSLVDMPITESVTVLLGMLRMLLWLVSRLLTTAHWLPLPVYKLQTWELILGAVVLAGLVYPIWKKRDPQAHWAMWTLLSFPPFLLLTETTILGLPAGPSRYLYLASAGSSLLIAAALDWVRRTVHAYAFTISLLLILASSYFSLNQVKAISLYTSGRHFLASHQLEEGIIQLKRAIAEGADLIPLEDAYYRLCSVKLGTGDDGKQCLAEARLALPESRRLSLMYNAFASFSDDPERRRRGVEEMRATYAALEREKRFDAAAMTGAVYYNIGLYFSRTQDVQKSAGAYLQALAYDRAQPNVLFNLAAIYNQAGQLEKSIDMLREARLLAPQNAVVHALLAEVLFTAGSVDAAIVAYQDALDLAKDDAAVHTNLGWALYTAERVEEAIEHYLQALRGQSYGVALFNLGLAYLAQGDIDASKQVYARAVAEYGAEYGEAIGAVADLRALAAHGTFVDAADAMLAMYWPQ